MGLTSSQWLHERDVHVMGVEEAVYKVRYRPGVGTFRNG
jgi:phenolic acid decarboxylase